MNLRDLLFRLRGFTPIPFLLIGLIWARQETWSLVVGGVSCLFGEAMRVNSLRHAGGATRTRNVGAPELVTSGPYARVRNPLYLANMLLYAGFAIGSGAFWPYLPLVILLFFSWQYGMIISLEERTLQKRFGDAYTNYCATVPRLWPSLRSRGSRKPPNYSLIDALREERSTLTGLLFSWILLALRLIYRTQLG